MNYRTGFEFDFMANFCESQSSTAVLSETVPFTNLQIALYRDEKKEAFLIKNEPGSRKRITFAHRQRDVLLFEMINCNLMLAKMKGQEGLENNYWTLIDAFGNIQAIPQKMKEILELRNWTKIQSKSVSCHQQDVQFSFETAYLIALTAYDDVPETISLYQQKSTIGGVNLLSNMRQEYNPFPDIGGILLNQ